MKDETVDRRTVVRLAGTAGAISLAGCLGGDDDPDDGEESDDENASVGGETDESAEDEVGSETETRTVDEPAVYAFGPTAISVIDPESGTVVDELTDGIDGAEWGDALYVAETAQVFAIERTRAQVVVIDAAARTVDERIDMGPGGVHMFQPRANEVWAHSDDEGTFYVIDVDELRVTGRVIAGLQEEGHGKVVHHDDLGDKAYATNVNDAAGLVVDLEAKERTGEIPMCEGGGTHYAAYASENGSVYFECTTADTTTVVDADTDEIVDSLDVSGGTYVSPAGDRLAILDENDVHVFDTTTRETERLGTIELDEAGPDSLGFYDGDDGTYAFVANTLTPDVSVLDLESFEEIDRLAAGDIERPEGARFLHRSGITADGYYVTPADGDGVVALIDMEERAVHERVDVEPGVDTVTYVGTQ
ncbi:YncE family protein (plasmid) [Haloferacaceae archaeon DSL9]